MLTKIWVAYSAAPHSDSSVILFNVAEGMVHMLF
jgi:hypothetical protein